MTKSDDRRFGELGLFELRLQLLLAVERASEQDILAQRLSMGASSQAEPRWVDDAAQARYQQAKFAALLCRFVGEA